MSTDYSTLFNSARPVKFISEWEDGSIVETPAMYNEETCEVFDIQQNESNEDRGGLVFEYIRYFSDDFQEEFEIEICPICHNYAMKEVDGNSVCCNTACENS